MLIPNIICIGVVIYAMFIAFGWLGVIGYLAYNVLCFLHEYEKAKRNIQEQQRAAGTWWSEL